jgi:dTDP-L-rhamnose 4-epimerase
MARHGKAMCTDSDRTETGAQGARTAMKILVTGGAGFIGSHTCDRLLSLGHQVIVLDALTPPVHRDGVPAHLSLEADFYLGDVRNRDLVTNLLRRVDAVYHFAAYQDYLPDFSRFSDVNVVSTAMLYEIIVAERLNLARVVVASSQSAMGEGLYWCPVDGEQTPGMRPESALAASRWDIPCPVCSGPLELRSTPERFSNPQNAYGMSKLGEEMVAVNLGRRYGIPTVALRYSIVQGPRQSVYNAYSGACRIFCLSYRLGRAPTLYEDGRAIRDYVNIGDVVDANVLVLSDDRAVGRVFNVGGGQAVTTREFADTVRRHYGSAQPGVVTGEYRFGDTRHILSDITSLRALGWEPRRTPAESVAAYADWLDGTDGLDGVLAEADARMRALGVVRKAGT